MRVRSEYLPAGRRGMTLLELTIVILILGALLAVVAPNLTGTRARARLKSAAYDLAAMIRYARSTAIFSEIETQIQFDPERGRYKVDYDTKAMDLSLARRRHRSVGLSRRRLQEREERMARQWLRVHKLPRDRAGIPYVYFVAVPDQIKVKSKTGMDRWPTVVFYPDGSSSGGTIVLENRRGKRMSIDIYAATGLPEVSTGDSRENPDSESST